PVKRASDLRNTIGLSPVGEKIVLDIVRDGKQRQVTAAIRETSGQTSTGTLLSKTPEGAALRNLRRGEVSYAEQGVLVESVEQGGAAWRAGMRAGDVIINANRRDVVDMDGLKAAITDKDAPLLLRINREGGVFFIVIR